MPILDTRHSQLASSSIQHHTLFTAVGLICDIRLGLILASELGIIASNTGRTPVAAPILGLVVNWVTLKTFRKYPHLIVGNWSYLCSDLVVTCIVVTTLPTIFSGGLPLSLAYIITSSVLIGLVSQAFWASLWSVGVTLSLALLKLHNTSLPTVVAATMVAGIFISILLGNRLNSQFAEISRLSNEAAFARAEERALAERLLPQGARARPEAGATEGKSSEETKTAPNALKRPEPGLAPARLRPSPHLHRHRLRRAPTPRA